MRTLALALCLAAVPLGAHAQDCYARPVEPGYVGNWFYVDENRAGGSRTDWSCSGSTYDQHAGTDFSMADGHSQSEGIPVTAMHAGNITRAVDGYYDGCRSCEATCPSWWTGRRDPICCTGNSANRVNVRHAHDDYYFHFRYGSVLAVRARGGDIAWGDPVIPVACGAQLAEMGASGCAWGTHVHVEPRTYDGAWLEPFAGACSRTSTSFWCEQGPWRGMPVGCDPLAGYHGTLIHVLVPDEVLAGDRVLVVVDVRNDGPSSWDGRVGLSGASGFADPSWASPDRPARVAGVVAQSGVARFELLAEAPLVGAASDVTEVASMTLDGAGVFEPIAIPITLHVVPTDVSVVDEDGDGFVVAEDCDDTRAAFHPRAPDGCDGLDQDCDSTDCGRPLGDAGARALSSGCDATGAPSSPLALVLLLVAGLLLGQRRRIALAALIAGCHGAPSSDDSRRGDAGTALDACVPMPEQCNGVDDDCDGLHDEGCGYHFGRPSPLTGILPDAFSAGRVILPRPSADGARLYFGATGAGDDGWRFYVSERSGATFGLATPVAIDGSEGMSIAGAAVSGDELEAILEILIAGEGWELYRTTRTSRSAPFAAPVRLDVNEAGSASDLHPLLRRDGLELVWTSDRAGARFWRALRTSPSAPFGPAEPLGVALPEGAAAWTPALSADGLTLFFTWTVEGVDRIFRATRPSASAVAFGPPSELAELGAYEANHCFYVDEERREAFFVSNRPWSPLGWTAWRVRVCFDGPCLEPQIDCPSRVRTADRLHCYQGFSEPLAWDAAERACGTLAPPGGRGHLVTISSREEDSAARSVGGPGDSWIGASDVAAEGTWAWTTGEPMIYRGWASGQPDDWMAAEDWGSLWSAGGWNDSGAAALPYVCETEIDPPAQ